MFMKKFSGALLTITSVIIILTTSCGDMARKKTLFRLLDPEDSGVTFSNALEESHEMNIISYPDFYSGGGVALGDIDNDGLADIFFTGNQVPCVLYKNMGDLVFEDITEKAGLSRMGRGWYTGVAMVDVNADGFLDIYISKSGMEAPDDRANLLFINNQDGTFSEKAREFGLDNKGFGVNSNFFDYDRDGDLDVYVTNQVSARLNSSQAEGLRKQVHPYAGDKLYENMGDDTFVDVTVEAGLYSSEVGFAHGASVGDINGDGLEDLFVSNDFFEYDYLYLNNGDKTFTECIKKATKHISHFSMGNDLADFDNDGLLDLAVLDMVAEDNRRLYSNTGGHDEQRFSRAVRHGLHHQYMFNVLHLNNGNETFSEIGMLAGISRTDWSWAPLFADFDNDGWKDLFISNGLRKDIRNIDWSVNYRSLTQFKSDYTKFEASQWDMLLGTLPSEKVTNYIFKNNRDLTFSKAMDEWGIKAKSWSNGVAYGDLDNDGDLDLVVNNVDEPAFIHENTGSSNYFRFKFHGPAKNPYGLGTKVKINHGDNFQYQQLYTTRGYRSSMEPIMHFGLDMDTIVNLVTVIWPDGLISKLEDVSANQVLTLNYKDAAQTDIETKSIQQSVFTDITDSLTLQIIHKDNIMIDYMNEPMLPYKISTVGVAFDVGDVDGDGLDDFYLGGSGRYPGQLFIQDMETEFDLSDNQELWASDQQYDDVGARFFDADNDGDLDLYVISGGNEYPDREELYQDRLYINNGNGRFSKGELPAITNSASVCEVADFDADGDLDLFVGGRMVPGKYPLPADSYLLRNDDGIFVDITSSNADEFLGLGLVTDATWSDIDGDQDLDLIVVGEWMPVTIFENDGGQLTKKQNIDNGLEYSSGWWWSIETDDLDNDGDEDLVVGNMGLNYKYRGTVTEPLELYYGSFENSSKLNFIIGYHQGGKIYPTVDRTKVVEQNASIGSRIRTSDAYALYDLNDIYGEETLGEATNRKIYTLQSSVIINNGNGTFEIKPLDNYAQISNVNAIVVQDIDLDGNKDLILAGNLHGMEAETIRNDAGIGVWLKGDGHGNFQAIRFSESGLFIDGDVKYMKKLKTIHDTVLMVVKNNAPVQLVSFATNSSSVNKDLN